MEKSTDIGHKLLSIKYEKEKCDECNKIRTPSVENHQICYTCYHAKKRIRPSGNKTIDDFIRYTHTNYPNKNNGKMIFVPYEKFENIKLIGEGGFSKIYKATWIDSKISDNDTLNYSLQNKSKIVALKKLTDSKNITSKELNELKIFYHYSLSGKSYDIYDSYSGLVNVYYGITQDPVTQDLIFIMPYYDSDLTNYVTKDFFDIRWYHKLDRLKEIINGLAKIHNVNILHRDLHSGNILLSNLYDYAPSMKAKICDLGTSKSATENDDNNDNEEDNIYGIISYVAPEVLQGKKYTKASDIYSFGMIMWELMIGRRPFWDKKHNTELIIEICDGLRPPIITNAPEGYIDLMKECWRSDPKNRPTADEISNKIYNVRYNGNAVQTNIIESSDIGPVTTNNPYAIYKSRYLSGMIKSAASTRSLRSQSSITLKLNQLDFYQRNSNDKRKLKDGDSFNNGTSNKKIKPIEDENNDYATKELELDIDMNSKQFNDGT
ncbi:Bck1p [Rhizophagus irregularis DAOM 197198w]|uniref:Bck1p n=1 Tax=Rhizophagus irregularis (strain DAOM 197198w) TaxID=1432141 RepID=A0A015L4N4_RHIIW|nr:Bck1p [Rhizophagus irregularis DAOM 197198w]